MFLMVTITYVLSYLIPTKQKSVSLVIYSAQAFFLTQSGVGFAVRYAADQGWTTGTQLNNLNNVVRTLPTGKFTLIYDSVHDKLTSTGVGLNGGTRVITISTFSTFESQHTPMILDPSSPAPCLKLSTEVDFTIKNRGCSSVILPSFSSSWTQNAPTRHISTIYLGALLSKITEKPIITP